MAVTHIWYRLTHAHAWGGITGGETQYFIDYLSDTIKVSLHTSSMSPSRDVHDFWDDTTNEVTGTGYTTKGAALASKTLGYTASTNVLKFDAADLVWSGSTITARYAVLFKDSGTSSTSPLISYVNFGANKSSSSGTFTLVWPASGIYTITVA
jgi:hypothetical protein